MNVIIQKSVRSVFRAVVNFRQQIIIIRSEEFTSSLKCVFGNHMAR